MKTVYFYTARVYNENSGYNMTCGNYSTYALAERKALAMCKKYGFSEECANVIEREFDLDVDIDELPV